MAEESIAIVGANWQAGTLALVTYLPTVATLTGWLRYLSVDCGADSTVERNRARASLFVAYRLYIVYRQVL